MADDARARLESVVDDALWDAEHEQSLGLVRIAARIMDAADEYARQAESEGTNGTYPATINGVRWIVHDKLPQHLPELSDRCVTCLQAENERLGEALQGAVEVMENFDPRTFNANKRAKYERAKAALSDREDQS